MHLKLIVIIEIVENQSMRVKIYSISHARFLNLVHYMIINIILLNQTEKNMKSKVFLWVSLLLFSFTCLSSCSEDEDDSYADKSGIIGTWYLIGASDGWGGYKHFDEGEITITFSQNGEMKVVNTREDQQPLATGTRQYHFTDIEESIYNHEPRPGISWGFLPFSYVFRDGKLELDAEAYDAPGYSLKRIIDVH